MPKASGALLQLFQKGVGDIPVVADDTGAMPYNMRQSALYWYIKRPDGFATTEDLNDSLPTGLNKGFGSRQTHEDLLAGSVTGICYGNRRV